MVSRVIPVDPFDLVIFGGTGDLTRRKILPALFRRYCAGQLPSKARIIGAARSEYDQAGYRDFAASAIAEFSDLTPPARPNCQSFWTVWIMWRLMPKAIRAGKSWPQK